MKIEFKPSEEERAQLLRIAKAEQEKVLFQAKRVKEAMLTMARKDPRWFCPYVIRAEGTSTPIVLSEYHKRWHELFMTHDRVVIWSHPEGGKTWQLIGYCLWRMGLNPNIRIAWVSNTYGQAERPVKAIMQLLTQSKELKEVFPKLKPSTRKGDSFGVHAITVERTEVSKDPTLVTCGAFGSILGARVDLLIIDDAIDFDNTREKEQRDKFTEWIATTVFSRLTQSAQVIVVGNAWHKDDMMHQMEQNSSFKAERFPVQKPDGSLGWPGVWDHARIEAKKAELQNPLLFARLYLCEVTDDASSKFPRAWINKALLLGKGRSFSDGLQSVPNGYRVFTGVDVGSRAEGKADRTVIFTICIHPNGCREVLNIEAGQWLFPETLQRLYSTHQRYQSIIYVESNHAQQFIAQQLNGTTAIPVKSFITGTNKHSEQFGIESMGVEFFVGKWIIPEFGSPLQIKERDTWISEMYNYSPAQHTGDSLMSSWIAKEGARQGDRKVEVGYKNWFGR